MPLFLKFDFNKFELCVKLDTLKIKLYVYFYVELDISNVEFYLNFQKTIRGKICIKLDIANVEFYL